ncbi:hypothetical protein B0H14DRAFT_3137809 [Mycena olivaceomarginata]|nr:hypothetical protein B0H14DRAFT_3137809 [Mycena olivaceomarginata]
MDDPWANAWGEPATANKLPPAPAFPPARTGDDEEDITIPSWESPSWSDNNSNSLWGARSPALDKFPSWHSPYDDLPLGKSSTSLPEAAEVPPEAPSDEEEDQEEAPEPEPETVFEREPSPEPAFESAPQSPVEEIPFQPSVASPVLSPVLPPNSPPGSPDAFGTFETGPHGLSSASDPWAPPHSDSVPEAADSAWGSAWGSSEVEERADEAPGVVDEWEAAKQQKALQDKHVPPELLASILLQFTELANDLHPPQPTPNLDPDDYRASRHKGLQGIDTLNPNVIRLLPTDLTLPPLRPFQKSITAKHTTDALRLSRSAAFVRFSPLSHYSATKGSTAWEASVKSRPEVVAEPDLLPPGWRIVETKKENAPVTDKKKGHGGLLSFFGRRSGTPPVIPGGDGATPRPSSPASSSPRASLDSNVKSPTSATSSTKSPTTTSAATSAASATPSAAVSPTAATPPPPTPVASVVSQTNVDAAAPDPITPVSAPSAVSRFLGRFGRKAPAAGGRQSLALSEGDFDFLSDIDGAADAGPSSGYSSDFAISGLLLDDPVPLPAKLAPPPPAPRVPVVTNIAPQTNGQKGPASGDRDRDELANFGTFTPPPAARSSFTPPPAKPFAPPLAPSISAPTPTPAPSTMSPVDSDVDFSAWGLDEEEKSGGTVRRESEPVVGSARAQPTRQALNTRAPTNTRGTLPPPRRVTAIMSSGPSKPPAAIPTLNATSLSFPPPPRTQTQTIAPILPPPPGTKAPAKAAALLDDDNDDFSDFHTPAAVQIGPAASANSLYDKSFSSSTSSDRGLFSSTSSRSIPANLFDDFDDFMEASPNEPATLRTPSPPRPPAKSPRILPPAPPSFARTPPTLSPTQDNDDTPLALTRSSLQQKQKRAVNDQRTLSLVESAAASSGVRWPAPESPLPEALAPPPDASDPFGFNSGSTMQSQQAAFLRREPPTASLSPPPATGMAPPPIRALSPPVLSPPPKKASSPMAFPPPPGAAPRRAFSPPPPKVVPTAAPMARFPPPPGATMRTFSPPAPSPPLQKVPAPAPAPMARFPPPPGATMRKFSPPAPSPPLQKVPAPAPAPMARFPPPPGATMRAFSPPAPSQTPMLSPPPQNGSVPPMLTAQRQSPAAPTPPPMVSTASGKSSGGLSAQDLSFFEGL